MRKLVLAMSLVIALAGCSSSGGTDVDSVADGVELIRGTVAFDYDPYDTPRAMLDDVDIALVGNVVSVDVAVEEMEPESLGLVVVGLEPTEIWKDDPSRSGDVVYYYFSRPSNVGVEPYREALPEGTEVVLFGYEDTDRVTSDIAFDKVYAAAPQGLFIGVAEDQMVNVWAEDPASSEWEIDDVGDLRSALGM